MYSRLLGEAERLNGAQLRRYAASLKLGRGRLLNF
jgi:hypothetical protein